MLGGRAAASGPPCDAAGDRLVVLDLDSGEEKARVEVPSPTQGFLFPAPGFGRDVYYQSLTTIARVASPRPSPARVRARSAAAIAAGSSSCG